MNIVAGRLIRFPAAYLWSSSRFMSASVSPPQSVRPASVRKPSIIHGERSTLDFRARLSLIEACLRTNQLSRAQYLFNTLQNEKSPFSHLVDVHVHNSFMEAFVRSFPAGSRVERYQELFEWFRDMRSSGVTPNVTSYAILVKGAMQCQLSESFIVNIAQDMRRSLSEYKISPDALLQSHILDPAQVDSLRGVLSRNGSLIGPPTVHSQMSRLRGDLMTRSKVDSLVEDASSVSEPGVSASTRELLADFPEVKATTAGNLEYVKRPLDRVMGDSVEMSLFDRQLDIEQESFRVNLQYLLDANSKRKDAGVIGIMPSSVKILATNWHWSFMPVLQKQLKKISTELTHDRSDVAPFLNIFDDTPEKLSVVTISQFLKHFNSGEPFTKSISLVSDIGRGVEQEYKMLLLGNKKLRDNMTKDYHHGQEQVKNRRLLDRKFRRLKAIEMDKGIASNGISVNEWEKSVIIRVGSVLAHWFTQVARVPVQASSAEAEVSWQKAFTHGSILQNGKRYGIFRIHEDVARALENAISNDNDKSGVTRGMMLPKLLPMIVPPKPWITFDSGGYLSIKTACMRAADPMCESFLRDGSLSGKLDSLFCALDSLGQTPWRVNDKLLRHIIEAWNTGKPIAGLPCEISSKAPELPKPENYAEDGKVRYKWYRENSKAVQEYYDQKSQRITENYKLEIARAFVGKVIYFPHNIDFRGRAYPIPQLFSHIGNDLARSLLIFENAKPLGKEGLKWLKIHFANTYGFDKGTFEERVKFTDERMNDIMKSAKDPFGNDEGNQLWLKADKPWLNLSVAMELTEAVESGSPETFLSRLPVHQDGSCNGLQHYAALGGDLEGAMQVNLSSKIDRPADVYTAVAEKVRKSVARDLENVPDNVAELDIRKVAGSFSSPESSYFLAKLLTPERVDRKTVKQTVMTSVYGVTYVGAREQVLSRLKEKHSDKYSPEEMSILARYITSKVFKALDDMFSSAREIQNWLTTSAREIARSVPKDDLNAYQDYEQSKAAYASGDTNEAAPQERAAPSLLSLNAKSSVIWTTPVGITVVQPYKHWKKFEVKTALQSFSLRNSDFQSPVDIRRQTAAFPPNFVHSLDAAHMVMTAVECQRSNLSFASVHDSYWTHACDVPQLREILRDQFVKLHSEPILENLRDDFNRRFHDRLVFNVYPQKEVVAKLEQMNTGFTKYEYDRKRQRFVISHSSEEQNVEDNFVAEFNAKIEEISNKNESEIEDSFKLVEEGHDEVEEEVVISEEELAKRQAEDMAAAHAKAALLGLRKGVKHVRVWEPINLPPLPKRGDFDVNEVKNSEYFFN